jgi:alpha-tubulin suppressor-like RCC1 family protein
VFSDFNSGGAFEKNSGGFAVLKNGAIMAWGANTKGQLGIGATKTADLDQSSDTPVQVKNIAHAVDIDCSRATCFSLEKDGTVKAWGWGAIGGMGSGVPGRNDSNAIPKVVPLPNNVVAIHGYTSSGQALLSDGTVMAWGSDSVATGVYHQSWKPVKETVRK